MKHIKKFDINEATIPQGPVLAAKMPKEIPFASTSVAGSADAVVVYFDYDVKGEFGKTVKKVIDDCKLEIVMIKGNILVVSEGEGPKGGIKKFKKALGL